MATPTNQALQGPGDKPGYETHYCRRITTRTIFRRAQSYQGAATISSQHQCSSTPSTPTENSGEGHNFIIRTWIKLQAVFRPLKLLGGLLLLLVSLFVFASMLITCIDKIKNSVCRSHCGFLLGHTKIFNPINYILTISSRIFPIDYVHKDLAEGEHAAMATHTPLLMVGVAKQLYEIARAKGLGGYYEPTVLRVLEDLAGGVEVALEGYGTRAARSGTTEPS